MTKADAVHKVNLSEANSDSNSVNRRAVRALVIDPMSKVTKQAGGTPGGASKQLPEDPFKVLADEGRIFEPPFDLLVLSMLPEHNAELTPAIEAMEVNIEGFGHSLRLRFELPEKDKEAAKEERAHLTNFFNYANMDDSFIQIRRKLRRDLETTGNAYLEIIRNDAGDVQGLAHMPSFQTRITKIEQNPIKVQFPILELQTDGTMKLVKIDVWKRFRLFVQATVTHFRGLQTNESFPRRWFKEFGDPRVYDNQTGNEVTPEEMADFEGKGAMPSWRKANEIVHFKMYTPRSPYGLPRIIGSLLSIFGDRAAEEINFTTFKNNNIPSMVVAVSNGQLTEGTIKRIESFVESQIQGSDNYSKFLILEAEGELEGEDPGHVKIEVKPLTKEQHADALFQNYSQNNKETLRRAFRLPPIFVGKSDDYSRSTAETSRRLADEQVFAPERDEFDRWVNRRLFPEMGIIYHRFKSNSPNTTDNTELVKILSGAEKTGGMTPAIARIVLEDILGIPLPDFPEDFQADVPFSLLMAEAVKNKADPAEPGQQVTALKRLELVSQLMGPDSTAAEVISTLLILRKTLDERWQELATGESVDDGTL